MLEEAAFYMYAKGDRKKSRYVWHIKPGLVLVYAARLLYYESLYFWYAMAFMQRLMQSAKLLYLGRVLLLQQMYNMCGGYYLSGEGVLG
ncbi:hypothetical protein VNO80_08612 [Phaseolus coccineus]|uniref:Uncharacterized protein n=1 Tax=Phaseolus coccineus TaxID=3886 RepID=A0AAN9RBV5_PHACN